MISQPAAPLTPVETKAILSPKVCVAAVLIAVLATTPSNTTEPQKPAMPSEAFGATVPSFEPVAPVKNMVTSQPALAAVIKGSV